MEFFQKAKSVRLKSHHDKYLLADEDGEHVYQDRHGTVRQAMWTVEFVEYFEVVRLKSCYGKYLTASEDQRLLGVTGRKVIQSMPKKIDSSVEWEPIRDGNRARLKTRYGNYLRANSGLPPWRNSITHDIPHRHRDWILWQIDVVEIRPEDFPPPKVTRSETMDVDLSTTSFHLRTRTDPNEASNLLESGSSKNNEGRMIYYSVVDDDGNSEGEEISLLFKGKGLEDLTLNLEEETGLENIIVCSRNPLNGNLYPLRLALPPNNTTMHIVIVPPTSKAAADFLTEST